MTRRKPAGVQNSPEPLLTVRQIAQTLQVHEFSVYRWAQNGVLPFIFKVGGRWRCRREDLDKLGEIEQNELQNS